MHIFTWARVHPILLLFNLLRTCSRMFSKPPVGPVGAHINLTDTKWATVEEVVLGKALNLWIVDNARDNDVRACVTHPICVPPTRW